MHALSEEDVGAFGRDGYLFPITAFSETEALDYRCQWEEVERRADADLSTALKSGANHLVPFVDALSRDPRITDRVASLLGPDLILWACSLFIKEPGAASFISWHQDVHYWGLDQANEITAWLALSPATPESGCMRYVPGSHQRRVGHADTFDADNMLTRGQEIAVAVDESEAVDVVLRPGEFSMHHGLTFHASGPNRSADRRIAFAFRYIPTSNRQTDNVKPMASLARGTDRFGHFDLAPRPTRLLAPDAVERCTRAEAMMRAILLRGADQPGDR